MTAVFARRRSALEVGIRAALLGTVIEPEGDGAAPRSRAIVAGAALAGAGLLVVAGPVAGQPCHVGGHLGLASPTSSLPLGNFRDDPSRGLAAGLELGCRVGSLEVGVAPEVAALESILAWGFLAGAGRRIPLGADGGPWLRLGALGGMLLVDDGEEGVNAIFPGPRVRVPQSGPSLGASLRLAFPSTGDSSSSFYLEGGLRVGWLDAVIEPNGTPDGDRRLVYFPFAVGYTLGL